MFSILAVGIACHAAAPALAQFTIYVDNRQGRDDHSGLSPVTLGEKIGPLRTVQAAFNRATPGSRIILLPTGHPYRDEVTVDGRRVRGRPTFPIVLEGNGQVWRGDEDCAREGWVSLRGGTYALVGPVRTYGVLFVDGMPTPMMACDPWGTPPELAPKQAALYGGTIRFRVEPGKHPRDYALSVSTRRGALVLDRTAYVVVRNVHFRGFVLDGVEVRGPCEGIVFDNCKFSDNGRAGAFTSTNAAVAFHACFLERNRRAGLIDENFSRCLVQASRVVEHPRDVVVDASSQLQRQGEPPARWREGPFVVPEAFAQRRSSDSAQPPAEPQLERRPEGTPSVRPVANGTPKSAGTAPATPSPRGTPQPTAKPKSFFDE